MLAPDKPQFRCGLCYFLATNSSVYAFSFHISKVGIVSILLVGLLRGIDPWLSNFSVHKLVKIRLLG